MEFAGIPARVMTPVFYDRSFFVLKGDRMFPPMIMIGIVAAGGAAGSALRYILGYVLANVFGTAFPLGTFSVNLIGAFLIGLLGSLSVIRSAGPELNALLIAGLLGGFTTFSSMIYEGIQYFMAGRTEEGFLYLFAQLFSGAAACVLGIALAHMWHSPV